MLALVLLAHQQIQAAVTFSQREGYASGLTDEAGWRPALAKAALEMNTMVENKRTCSESFDTSLGPMMAVFRAVDRAYVLCMDCANFNATRLQTWPAEAAKKTILWSGPESDKKYCSVGGQCKGLDDAVFRAEHVVKASFAHYGLIAHAAEHEYERILIIEDDFCFNLDDSSWSGEDVATFEEYLKHGFQSYLRLSFYGYMRSWFDEIATACKCVPRSAHICEVQKHCDLRGSEAYVLHRSLFHRFRPAGHKHDEVEKWIDTWPAEEMSTQLVLPPMGLQRDFHRPYYYGGYRKYLGCSGLLAGKGGAGLPLCTADYPERIVVR